MSEQLKLLLSKGIITLAEYDTYVLYEVNELGRQYLKNILEASFMEKTESGRMESTYIWHDGRRSVWRDIKQTIRNINILMEKENERERNPEYQYGSAGGTINSGFSGYI